MPWSDGLLGIREEAKSSRTSTQDVETTTTHDVVSAEVID